MNWLTANRLGNLAAVKAHSRLGVDTAVYPIDVSAAIAAARLPLMFRPMHGLFGIYMEANHQRGIMVNAGLTAASRRHTAAHELGHHALSHRPDPARQCAIESDPARPGSVRGQGEIEMTAEAFATWFVMPRRAVIAALADMGIPRPSTADEVYLLSLLLGASYRATCRHLVSLKLVARAEADAWARVQPARLKRAAAGYAIESTLDVDVWSLRGGSALKVVATTGDLLVLNDQDAAVANGMLVLSRVETAGGTTVYRCDAPCFQQVLADVPGAGGTMLTVSDRPHGLYIPGAAGVAGTDSTEHVQ